MKLAKWSPVRVAAVAAGLLVAVGSSVWALEAEADGGPGAAMWAASALLAAAAASVVFREQRSGGASSWPRTLTAALLCFSAVRLSGGYGALSAPLYLVLLAWMAHPAVDGPALETGATLGLLEGLFPLLSGRLLSPDLMSRVAAGAIPFITLPASAAVFEWMARGRVHGLSGRTGEAATETGSSASGESSGLIERTSGFVRTLARAGNLGGAIHVTAVWLADSGSDLTVTVGLLSSDGESLDVYESLGPLSSGRVGGNFDLEGSVAGWTIKSRKSVSRDGLAGGGRPVTTLSRTDPSSSRCGSCSAAPLTISDRSIGMILVESPVEDGTGPLIAEALEVSSSLLGLAIEKILLREQKRDLETREGLTGLQRLPDFMDFVRRTSRDVYRFGRSMALFVVGIDSLEEVNSSLGYRSGDRLLKVCADCLSGIAGPDAAVTRLSGAKFAVCMPGMDQAAAEAFAESAMRSFASLRVSCGSDEVSPRVVIGGAVTRNERRVEALCGEASRAMAGARSLPAGFQVTVLLAVPGQGGSRP